MPDQSQLNPQQDMLMQEMAVPWEAVKASRGENMQATRQAAEGARDALLNGGEWPDSQWVEFILLVGAATCSDAIFNKGLYIEYYEIVDILFAEMTKRGWEKGGPTDYFDDYNAQALTRAANEWKTHMTERYEHEVRMGKIEPVGTKKRGRFRR